jgi:hypothetical protein
MGRTSRRFQQLECLLLGYRRKFSAQDGCVLKQIPTEIVDVIIEHLPPESAIALPLTCRALFVKHFPDKKIMAQLLSAASARETLLQWLEWDFPGLYFCYGCARLHRWSTAAFRYKIGFRDEHGPSGCNRTYSFYGYYSFFGYGESYRGPCKQDGRDKEPRRSNYVTFLWSHVSYS